MVRGELRSSIRTTKVVGRTLAQLQAAAQAAGATLTITDRGKDEPKIVKRMVPRKTSCSSK